MESWSKMEGRKRGGSKQALELVFSHKSLMPHCKEILKGKLCAIAYRSKELPLKVSQKLQLVKSMGACLIARCHTLSTSCQS